MFGTTVCALERRMVLGWILHCNSCIFEGGLEEFVLLSEESGTLKGDGSLEDMSQLHPTASDTHLFQIIRRTELGEMAGLFFNEWGMIIFYTILIVWCS